MTTTTPDPLGIHRVGDRAVLVDLPDLETVMIWHSALKSSPLPGQADVIAAARTILIVANSAIAAHTIITRLRNFTPTANATRSIGEQTIDVVYSGDDLTAVADTQGISTDALIDWHTGTTWVAAFGGFAPGFTYCRPEALEKVREVARRDTPRTEVPAGSVGLAGEFSAVYPRSSPGGWQLIGSTVTPMWDAVMDPPALLAPGDRVRYRAIREHATVAAPERSCTATAPRRPVARLDATGLQTLVEDLGREGHGDLGVTGSGAADRASAAAANSAVGNQRSAAVLENVGGLRLTALVDTVVCVTGGRAPVSVDLRPAALGMPQLLPAGAQLVVGPTDLGARSYLAVRGGVVAAGELGSASTDVLSGLGAAPLRDGAVISTPPTPAGSVRGVNNPLRVFNRHGVTHGVLRCVAGPRNAWFEGGADRLERTSWTVNDRSNRVGLRLDADVEEPLPRARTDELASEGMVAGSIQVPPDGNPVVFLRDHAVTGGYPVIATVIASDIDIAAQLPPGATVEFRLVDPDTLRPLSPAPAAKTDPKEQP